MSVRALCFGAMLEVARNDGVPLILDAAVGTALDELGVETGSPLWSGLAPLTHPDLLRAIHESHVEAGARVVTTCTFRTTARVFERSNRPSGEWRKAARAAVAIARDAAGEGVPVAGSMGPLENCFHPSLVPEPSIARREHAMLAAVLVEAGVDVLWLETFGTAREVIAAAAAARDAGEPMGIPFAASVVTGGDGKLLGGDDLALTALALLDLGAAAISVNCVPPWFVDTALDQLLPAVEVPVGVWANLGRAEAGQGWEGDAFLSPDEYAKLACRWRNRGVTMIGACCGSSATHILALSDRLSPRRAVAK